MKPTFLRPQHPKALVLPQRDAIMRLLAAGWVGQRKVHGRRFQGHVSKEGKLFAFTRDGSLHSTPIPLAMKNTLISIFRPRKGWNVFDAEWQQQENKVYVFDLVKMDDELLSRLNYEQRYVALQAYDARGRFVEFLPILRTIEECMLVLQDGDPCTEGLVFRNPATPGFEDSSIIRCRLSGAEFEPYRKA